MSLINLHEWKKKKQTAEAISRGRIPLSISHGRVYGTEPGDAEFNERMQRIRQRLERVNDLMNELKQYSLDKGESE